MYRSAWAALRHRVGNMDLLIVSGSSVAYIWSFVSMIIPQTQGQVEFFIQINCILYIRGLDGLAGAESGRTQFNAIPYHLYIGRNIIDAQCRTFAQVFNCI